MVVPVTPAPPDQLTRRAVLALAWPIVLAQMATALTGVVDTAVMGRFDDRVGLSAVAIAAVSFQFIYWGFGFLRMATTGLIAQAEGTGNRVASRQILARALLLGAGLGLAVLVLFPLLRVIVLAGFQAPPEVEAEASAYFAARIGGAPAALMGYAVMGWLIGTGRTRALLAFQIVLNGTNAGLDAAFVGLWDLGPAGIGLGTAIAEWVALAFGLWLLRGELSALRRPRALLEPGPMRALLAANRDIMVRTLALLFSFAWFINSGAEVGTAQLAGNQVLLQFVAVSAFVLDAFAYVTEAEVGKAFGAGDVVRLRRSVRLTSELAVVFGIGFSLLFWGFGDAIIRGFVVDVGARDAALAYLPWCAAVPVLGVAAWQLDGIFLGALRGHALRNAGVAAAVAYILTDVALGDLGNAGVWAAFLTMYVWRAGFLALGWRGLTRAVAGGGLPRLS